MYLIKTIKGDITKVTDVQAIVNLPPRSMMGIDSCGMLLSAIHNVNGEEKLNLVMLDDAIPAGAKLY